MGYTRLKVVLVEEDINQKELCDRINEIDLMKTPPEPGILYTVMSIIVNGKRHNLQIRTMNKIVNGINVILEEKGLNKRYNLDDIFGKKK